MITLASLKADYGAVVDRELIASIWAEQRSDPGKCRNIIHMLGGGPEQSDGPGTADSNSESASTRWSEPGSASSEESSRSSRARVDAEARLGGVGGAHQAGAIDSLDALVGFLGACFPECGVDYLRSEASRMFPSGKGARLQVDPVEAIDMISNALYNDLEAIDNQQFRQAQQSGGNSGMGATQRQGKSKKKEAAPPVNAWGAIDAELDRLCSMFPMLAVGTVRSAYHANAANADRAATALVALAEKKAEPRSSGAVLRQLAGKPPAEAQPAEKQARPRHSNARIRQMVDGLRELFPSHSDAALTEAVGASTDIDAAAERLLLAASRGSRARRTTWQRVDVDVPRTRAAAADEPSPLPSPSPAAHSRQPLSALVSDAREWVGRHSADAAYCRQRAAELFAQRNEMYTRAATAYAHRLGSGSALHYSAEGHACDASARVWRMRAAQAAVAAMRRNDANFVDLHGLTRMEAVAVVLDEVAVWRRCPHAAARPLRIVTGLGSHSVDRRARLHPAVIRVLRERAWHFTEDPGYIEVHGYAGP
ncbi:hypothetical protein GGI04_000907 [Coemansia thaxteri]|nr:hypothetical protein GGI04_000907 [Coemansia thaxteri]KAJ2473432.1 hypothetical protein GGI02_000843 [Coemansia sp. RSA 2322]